MASGYDISASIADSQALDSGHAATGDKNYYASDPGTKRLLIIALALAAVLGLFLWFKLK